MGLFQKRYSVMGLHNAFEKTLWRYQSLKKSVMTLWGPPAAPPLYMHYNGEICVAYYCMVGVRS